jgi:SAM-dependent methyltransferase
MLPEFEAQIKPKAGRTLIVGSRVYGAKEDRRKRYPQAVGVDMQMGDGVDLLVNLEPDFSASTAKALGKFAHIECMSVLEHCRRPWLMAANLERVLEPGGTILVAAPFVWRVHSYPDDYFRFTVNGVKALFNNIEWTHEAYSHRTLCKADDVPAVRAGEDWPYFARTEVFVFGHA